MSKEIVIIGGGVSGLSAAIRAIESGFRPILLEKNRALGGRVRSFFARDMKRTMDNGQHVLSAAYEETIDYLRTINSIHKVYFQKNFNCLFLKDPLNHFHFRTAHLPAPLHFFIPLVSKHKYTNIQTGDYVNFIRCHLTLSEKKLNQMTVEQWMAHCQQSDAAESFLWKPFTLAMLNTHPRDASAYQLITALKKSFLKSREAARLGILKDWLSETFIHPAEKYLLKQGGIIHRFTSVQKFVVRNSEVIQVVTSKGPIDSPWIINTTPPYALMAILQNSGIRSLAPLEEIASGFTYNPIITVNIILKKPLNYHFPVAPVESPLQWIFAYPDNHPESQESGYTLVMSDAREWAGRTADDILRMVQSELQRLFGIDLLAVNGLLRYKVIKEKRATIAQTPEAQQKRPGVRTALTNFFLAGDWIDTDLPATIESAILSGKMAVSAIRRQAGPAKGQIRPAPGIGN